MGSHQLPKKTPDWERFEVEVVPCIQEMFNSNLKNNFQNKRGEYFIDHLRSLQFQTKTMYKKRCRPISLRNTDAKNSEESYQPSKASNI